MRKTLGAILFTLTALYNFLIFYSLYSYTEDFYSIACLPSIPLVPIIVFFRYGDYLSPLIVYGGYGLAYLIYQSGSGEYPRDGINYKALRETGYYCAGKMYVDPVITKVVGVTFENRQANIQSLSLNDTLELNRELKNQYDPNAIKVTRSDGAQIGYIKRELAEKIKHWFDMFPFHPSAKVIKITGNSKTEAKGVIISINPPTEADMILALDIQYPRLG